MKLGCQKVNLLIKLTMKLKYTLVQALRLCTGRTAHRGNRGIALLIHDHGSRRGWGVSVTPCRSLPSGKTRYPLYRRLDGPQRRSGQVRKISPPPGFDPRTVQPVASRYTDYATRPTIKLIQGLNYFLEPHIAIWCRITWQNEVRFETATFIVWVIRNTLAKTAYSIQWYPG